MCLEPGKSDKVCTQAKPGALTRSEPDAGRKEVQESERQCGDDGNRKDLLKIEFLLGNDERGQSNGQALQEILNGASHNFCE